MSIAVVRSDIRDEVETIPSQDMKMLQVERLRAGIDRLSQTVPFYQEKLREAGVTDEDVVHNAYGYGLFTGGLGFHYGAERLGAIVIPVSGGNTKRQLLLMCDFGSTVLCCTPSYSLLIAEVAAEEGIDLKSPPPYGYDIAFQGADAKSAN